MILIFSNKAGEEVNISDEGINIVLEVNGRRIITNDMEFVQFWLARFGAVNVPGMFQRRSSRSFSGF